ncbi:MAG TPA: DedA family protein [Thermoleophilaceae bacterium]
MKLLSAPETGTRGRVAIAAAFAAGAALALALALAPVDLPDPAAGLSSASSSLGEWAYLAVPALAFLETAAFVGLLVPGETAVVVGGVVAERGDVALPAMIALVWIGAVTGDLVSFALGRRLGRPFLDSHGARLRIRPAHVERVERFFARYGGRAVLVGRFVGILRALTPFVAGASRLPLRRFLPYSLVGALGWAATFTVVGYVFASSFESAGEAAARIALGGAVLVAVALVLVARRRRPGRADAPGPNLTQRRPTPFSRHGRNVPLQPNGRPDRRAAPGRRRPRPSRPVHAGGPHRGIGPP